MKHLKKGRKFGRKINQRKALIKSLLGNILEKEEIVTTEAKAKEMKPVAERFVSNLKKMLSAEGAGSIHALRNLLSEIPSSIKKKKLEEIAKRFAARNGGYVRIVKMAPRKSDSAKMARIMILKK